MPPIDTPVKNVTAAVLTFNFVRDNSGMYTTRQIADMLGKHGYTQNTLITMVYQMTSCGMFFVTKHGKIGTTLKEYTSLYLATKKAKEEGKIVSRKSTKVAKAVKVTASVQAKTDKLIDKKFWINKSNVWNPEQVANSLNLVQAHALYSYMNQFFGDKKLKETV
jgi:hypothetical protein